MSRKIKKREDVPNVRNEWKSSTHLWYYRNRCLNQQKHTYHQGSRCRETWDSFITGFNFCDDHLEAIKPRLTMVVMDDESTVLIIRQPSKPNSTVPLPEEQVFNKRRKSESTKSKTTKRFRLNPENEKWVEATSKWSGISSWTLTIRCTQT